MGTHFSSLDQLCHLPDGVLPSMLSATGIKNYTGFPLYLHMNGMSVVCQHTENLGTYLTLASFVPLTPKDVPECTIQRRSLKSDLWITRSQNEVTLFRLTVMRRG